MPASPSSIVALDVGSKRVGVAVASLEARLPRPLVTLEQSDTFFDQLHTLLSDEAATAIVIGLPRGLDGQHTAQTQASQDFAEQLRSQTDLPIHMQDEAVTSKKAEEELESRGKPYKKGDIDALAATYILSDFLAEQGNLEGLSL